MVSAFLNTCPILPSPGHYLLQTLQYYGYEFKSDQMAIVQGEYIMIPPDVSFADQLVVLDLFFPEINAASTVTQFNEIRSLFQSTCEKIRENATKSSILKLALAGGNT